MAEMQVNGMVREKVESKNNGKQESKADTGWKELSV